MIDFLIISTRANKKGGVEIYPNFIVKNRSEHLMIRGGDFYAIWVEERGLWSTNEQDVIDIVDHELDKYAKENADKFPNGYRVLHMWDSESGMIDRWHRYCQHQMRDSFHMLDEKLIFSNTQTSRKDYASKRLPYPLEQGEIKAWDRMMSVLYSPEERAKIEWAIGSIVSGDSQHLQKFMVFYGAAGTGKSTVLNVIQQLFEGYTSVFDAKALGSSSNSFALEAFKSNPLVAIQHDGDLSRIEDNTRLNSLVSHELMTVNEKFKSTYANRFKCFLFMGTNRPVKITDAKSGLIRRLIDVSPTGEKLKASEYKQIMKQITFELGSIASHCLNVYKANPNAYDDYIPLSMLGASNDFYNFVMDSWYTFDKEDGTTLNSAWAMYKKYCEDAKVAYPYTLRAFKEELKNYFRNYKERETLSSGERVRSHYTGFIREKFEEESAHKQSEPVKQTSWIDLKRQSSIFDSAFSDCFAQYASEAETPMKKWVNVKTTLSDISTDRVHYVKVPTELICIDFDITDENGEKCFDKNLEEASKWPPTYAEVSKSGKAIHLYYIYKGDTSKLSSVYADHIEVKVFTGNSSLRRKLTLCNDIPVATITHGLPLKEEKKVINFDAVQSEKSLRNLIKRNLAKEFHPGTKPSIDFIYKILDDAYKSDLTYDVSDMRNAILGFAANSTHQADYCIKLVGKMKFKSEDKEICDIPTDSEAKNVYYDIECFPNLFIINWKIAEDYGPKDFEHWEDYIHKLSTEHKPVVRMINPTPIQVEEFLRVHANHLVDFNGRKYDRHMCYARLMGYSNVQLYELSTRIIKGDRTAMFGDAYNLGKTDVYDFASAGNKKSLKKLEIEMGFHHQELGLPWDKPVPEPLWPKVAQYCDNDVIATEAAFNYLEADWTARQILADIAGMTVNDTTNMLTTRIIFNGVKKPQSDFEYRDLAEPVRELKEAVMEFLKDAAPDMMSVTHGDEDSILPYFPGYSFVNGVSTYRGEEVGEGGYVYAEPGMYGNVALLDIMSMHPHSVIAECLFGPTFTRRFKEIVDGRVSIKHKAWEDVNDILDGKLTRWIEKVKNGEMSAKQLANALKTAINSVYGLTSAAFDNAFRDPRNRDNIVAKRGALFMIDLKHAVQERGFTVAHIKTDSIKIPDATPEIIQFVMEFGKLNGYYFEHEATYDKMCLVNDAVYIAKYDTVENCVRKYGYCPGDVKDYPGTWTATGKQFAVPYVFKKLFSREDILFEDMCETFSVSGALYLDTNESLPDVTIMEKNLADILKKNGLSQLDLMDLQETGSIDKDISNSVIDQIQYYLSEIEKGHQYHFVGKVGQFTPIKPGNGAGILLRESGGKYSAATGSKGYRWMESEMVRTLNYQDKIDRGFYDRLVDDAKDAIAEYGDFEWFVSEDMYDVPSEDAS